MDLPFVYSIVQLYNLTISHMLILFFLAITIALYSLY